MIDITSLINDIFPNVSAFDALLLFSLILTRWLVMSMMMPFLGAELLPSIVRLVLCALLSAITFLLLVDHIDFSHSLSIVEITLLFIKEALIGFILGFFSSLIFYAYELAGELIDLARAASMAKLLVPELKHQSSPMGNLLFQLALVIFIASGFHREIIKEAYRSFTIFPVLSLDSHLLNAGFFSLSIEILGTLFAIAFRFSLPVVVMCFVIDIAFGLMNRVAPQINAYFLSLPAKMIGGLLIFLFVLPFLMGDFADHYLNLSRFFLFFLNKNTQFSETVPEN